MGDANGGHTITLPSRLALALATAAFLHAAGGLRARQPAKPPAARGVLPDDDRLDDLVAPIALYPDALLAQVLVAATYPLDVVRAQRWVGANTVRLSNSAAALLSV